MPRIIRSDKNIVAIPTGVSVNSKGYVYLNRTTVWVDKKNGTGKTADHKKECIGIVVNPDIDWTTDRRMYPNIKYYELFHNEVGQEPITTNADISEYIQDYPERSDCVSIGFHAVAKKLTEVSKLVEVLAKTFDSEAISLILDLACYMLSEESAVFQHFPHWARSQALFSDAIHTDSYISRFVKSNVTLSQIEQFKKNWFQVALEDGRIYLCYDSTNVNCQTEGVFIVQKGHAKDDPSLDQVNLEYVIRQKDSMPLTYKCYPGSINDVAEASEIIEFLREMLDTKRNSEQPASNDGSLSSVVEIPSLILIADRGYISEENLKSLSKSGIGFLMIMKRNMDLHDQIIDAYLRKVKSHEHYISESGRFAMTVSHQLFASDEQDYYFHIVWDAELELAHRAKLDRDISAMRLKLQKALERQQLFTETELKTFHVYYDLQYHQEGTLNVNQRGRGAGKTKKVPAFRIDSYAINNERVQKEDDRCGYSISVSDSVASATEAITALSKRDCVEKSFMALKSHMGMDKFGVHFESSMHTKILVWFVASIIHALLFEKTERLRATDRKHYTVPAIINLLEEVTADRDLASEQYKRRYKLTKHQRKVLACFGISDDDIDASITDLVDSK